MWHFYRVAFSSFVGMVATQAQMGIQSFLLLQGESNLEIINEKRKNFYPEMWDLGCTSS